MGWPELQISGNMGPSERLLRVRLFITGASGFVGAKLCEVLAGTWHLTGTYRTGTGRVPRGIAAVPLEIRDAAAVEAALVQSRPDAIVHTAAVADLGRCEREPGAAAACNVEGTRHVAAYARRARVPLVYLSTDLVFDGQRGAYAEGDVPSPVCVYGATKYAGERAALTEHPDACILRLALTYGKSANSQHCFLERMLHALRNGEQVRLFVDEYRTPILLDDLCATVERALAANLTGVFHVAGPRRVSRYELGSEAAEAFGLPSDGIVPASRTGESPARPADCSMRSSSVLAALGCKLRDPAEGLLYMAASAPAVSSRLTTP
jgi:dTDP-4-dehydrorhamnose reductase